MLKDLKWKVTDSTAAEMVADNMTVFEPRWTGEEQAHFLATLIVESRSTGIDDAGQALMDFLDREAWKAAFRWTQMRARSADPAMCNAALGSALALVATWSILRSDDWENPDFFVLAVGEDGCAFPLPEEALARRQDMV